MTVRIKESIYVWKTRLDEIEKGYQVYKRIKAEYGKKISICVSQHRALGDAYLAGLYLNSFYKKDFVVTALGEGARSVYQYLNIKNIKILNEEETNLLISFCHFVGIPQEEVRVLHHQALSWDTGIAWNLQGVREINFAQLMESVVFPGMTREERAYPEIKVNLDKEEYWKEQGVIKEKSMILFPHANTLLAPPVWFWELLVKRLKEKYEYIFTYIYGDEEKITGTKAINEDIEYLASLVQYAGNVIGVRNGLTDIFAPTKSKKIILYPQIGTESWIVGNAKKYWSIQEFGYCKDAIELEWDEYNLEQLVERIVML